MEINLKKKAAILFKDTALETNKTKCLEIIKKN